MNTEDTSYYLARRIERQGHDLGNGILDAGFINHQIDPSLMIAIGCAFKDHFAGKLQASTHRAKVFTAESSGIAPALATALAHRTSCGESLSLVYARKSRPVTMPNCLHARAPSPTRGGVMNLFVTSRYLQPNDHVLIIDDFLASGQTILALVDLIRQAGAILVGIGCVLEKSFQDGRANLTHLNVPVISLVTIHSLDPIVVAPARTEHDLR